MPALRDGLALPGVFLAVLFVEEVPSILVADRQGVSSRSVLFAVDFVQEGHLNLSSWEGGLKG